MLSILFCILMIWVFGKMLSGAVRLTWGVSKILLQLVFLPLILVGMAFCGLLYVAVPILLVLAAAVLFV